MSPEGKLYFITSEKFRQVLDAAGKEGKVYIPRPGTNRAGETNFHYEIMTGETPFEWTGYRPNEPLKTFLFTGRMKAAEYPSTGDSEPGTNPEPVTIVGGAACDIESLRSLDAVFLQDSFTDIFYRARRTEHVLISADCTEPRDTCLCTLAGINPYPTSGFDLNLSMVENGYLVEIGSKKGEELISPHAGLFTKATDELIRMRDEARAAARKKVEELNKQYVPSRSRREILEIQRESEDWYEQVKTCIECGACLFACPTCHCFLLYDQVGEKGTFQRIKEWDACSYGGYSRMAGGSSPRLGIMERFRHRYLHKFEYFPKNYDFEACTGCGRCIEGCMGKIDMRKVLKALDTIPTGAKTS